MEINTKYILRDFLKLYKTDSYYKYYKNNKKLLIELSTHKKITKDVIDFYKLDKIEGFYLEYNPNFKIEWVKIYKDYKWDFQKISHVCCDINIEWFKLYPNENWNFENLTNHNNFNIKWLDFYPNKKWDFHRLTYKNNSIEMYQKYPNKNWDKNIFCSIQYEKINNTTLKYYIKQIESEYESKLNKNILQKYINNPKSVDYMEYFICDKIKSNYIKLQLNKNFNINWIHQYPNKPWHLYLFLKDTNFKISILKNFSHINWCYECINLLPNFKIEWLEYLDIKKYIEFDKLHLHPNFKLSWIEKYPDKEWNFFNIKKELIDINFVKKYPDKNWNVLNIIKHPKFTKDIIKNTTNIYFKLNYEIYFNKYFNPMWFEEYKNIGWVYNKIEETHNFDVRWVLNYYNMNWPYIYDKNNYKKSYNKEELINESYYTLLNFDKDFDIEWINKYPEKKWNYEIICLHPNFKIEWLETISKTINRNLIKSNFFDLIVKNKNFKLEWLSINLKYKKSWNYYYITNVIIRTEEQLYNFLKFANNHINTHNNFYYRTNINPKLIRIEMLIKFDKIFFDYNVLLKN